MRLRLQKNKQKELINNAKVKATWANLSKKLNFSPGYLRNELKNEKTLLSEECYNKLCLITNKNYDSYILEKLEDNWGRIKGSNNSKGNLKITKEPNESKELAELFGIILGDGHVHKYINGKKTRCYFLRIANSLADDYGYLSNYVKDLIKKLFNETPKIMKVPKHGEIFITIYGKNIIEFLNKKGLKSGNKKTNNQTIPNWILKNKEYLVSCIRGLIDTDGSIHYISKNNKNLRISFTSYIPRLLKDVRASLIKLGFHPSKIIKEKQIFLSRKEEIKRYIETVGFGNQKHLKRYRNFTN